MTFLSVFGREGLSFRGKRHKCVHEILDPTVHYGDFIEIVKLFAESDDTVREHIESRIANKKSVEKRKKPRQAEIIERTASVWYMYKVISD